MFLKSSIVLEVTISAGREFHRRMVDEMNKEKHLLLLHPTMAFMDKSWNHSNVVICDWDAVADLGGVPRVPWNPPFGFSDDRKLWKPAWPLTKPN